MKKRLHPLWAAILAGGLLLGLYALKGLYPFGMKTISWCDMNQQVIPILCEFKDILKGNGTMFLNLHTGGGMNFWGVFLFFISSPFSFLVAFVDKSEMMLFANILVLLKMMVCAGTAAFFFDRWYPRLPGVFSVLLGVSYAFCGYTMLFYQNMVWLDMMALFPLFLLSLRHLQKTGNFVPYTLALTAMLAVNFYLSYMLVLFFIFAAGLWVTCFAHGRNRGRQVVQLAAGTISAALLTGVIWLPALLQFLNSARGASLLATLHQGSFFSSAFSTSGMMLLCCAVMLPAFLVQAKRCFTGKTMRAQELFVLTMFLLMLIALMIEPVNKMWHTGSYQAFPGRYGYMPVLLGLMMAAQLLSREPMQVCSRSRIGRSLLVFLGIGGTVLLGEWLLRTHWDELTAYTRTLWNSREGFLYFMAFAAAAALCYALGLYFYHHGIMTHRVLGAAMALLVAAEGLFYGCAFFSAHSDTYFREAVALEGHLEEGGFYRVKNARKDYDVNLTGGMGMNTLNHYTSLTGKHYMHGVRKLGYSAYWMETSSVGGTLISDALLNHQYTIMKRAPITDDTVAFQGIYSIRENPFFLPLGLVTAAELTDRQDLALMDRPMAGQEILETLLGEPLSIVQEHLPLLTTGVKLWEQDGYTLIERTDGQEHSIEYRIPAAPETRTYYFDCFSSLENHLNEPYYNAFTVYVNGQTLMKEYPTQSHNGILALTVNEDQPVSVTVKVHKNVSVRSFGVFSISHEALQAALNAVDTAPVQVQGNTISGTAYAENPGEYLFLSLPYDEGYTAKVNGQNVQTERVFDTWMAVPLLEGSNQITLTYSPPGFWLGAILSGMGVVVFLLAGWFLCHKKKRLPTLESPLTTAVFLFAGLTFVLVYLMPSIYYIVYHLING